MFVSGVVHSRLHARLSSKDRDDYREYLLKLAADRLHIEVPSLERDIKMAKDYWRSLGCDVDGFCETSRKSD